MPRSSWPGRTSYYSGGRRGEEVFSAAERSVLRFTDLLTSYPGNIDPSALDALDSLFTGAQIVELVLVIGTANWTNRVNDGLQTPLS